MNRFGDIEYESKRLPPFYGYHSQPIVSIEKALEPIESIIDQLSLYIKIAKTYCHFPSEHGLSKDQSAAIYIYTMEWGRTALYRVLNQALRSENRHALKVWFPFLKLFDSALEKLPTVNGVIWRGISLDIGRNYHENEVVTWRSVNSCSASVDVIKKLLGKSAKSTLFLIQAKNGKRIRGYTQFEHEDEIILPLGTQLRVKGHPLERPEGTFTVHLIETNEEEGERSVASAMKKMEVKKNESKKQHSGNSISFFQFNKITKWKQVGRTVAGGNGQGNQLNQFDCPNGIYVDDDNQCIFIADWGNHRVIQWKFNATNGQVVAGGNARGNQNDQLNSPTGVIVDRKTNSLLICDYGNRRIVRWTRQNGQKVISNILCSGLTMDHQGNLYVSDEDEHEVRRFKVGDSNGTIVAGGYGKGNRLDQLADPSFIFVDKHSSIYVSDSENDRVMKWMKGAKQGIVVAGGSGPGNRLKQLNWPRGLFVDHLENVFVCDWLNHRVMCWSKGSREGRIVVGGNGQGNEPNQLNYPQDLSFDREGNLYVSDCRNHRIQKFEVESK